MCQRTKHDVRSPIQSWSAYKDDAGIGDTALCHYVTINIINTSTPDSDNNIFRGKLTISKTASQTLTVLGQRKTRLVGHACYEVCASRKMRNELCTIGH